MCAGVKIFLVGERDAQTLKSFCISASLTLYPKSVDACSCSPCEDLVIL